MLWSQASGLVEINDYYIDAYNFEVCTVNWKRPFEVNNEAVSLSLSLIMECSWKWQAVTELEQGHNLSVTSQIQ